MIRRTWRNLSIVGVVLLGMLAVACGIEEDLASAPESSPVRLPSPESARVAQSPTESASAPEPTPTRTPLVQRYWIEVSKTPVFVTQVVTIERDATQEARSATFEAEGRELKVVATRLLAILEGRLFAEQGCLRVTETLGSGGETRTLLFIPSHHQVTWEGDTVHVVDLLKNVEVTWRLGDKIRIGGGGSSPSDDPEGPRPVHRNGDGECPGPYWVVGGVESSEPTE